MKSLHRKITTSSKIKTGLILFGLMLSAQGCFFEDQEPNQENVCSGLSNEYARNATAGDCEISGGEWIEGEGCYCHGS